MPELNPAATASLHRRLAEAADGYRTGEDLWFAADRKDPDMMVSDPFPSVETAMSWAEENDRDVFGPFNTPDDEQPDNRWEILQAAVWARSPQGDYFRQAFDPSEIDAIFLSKSAIDKFLIPYMTRIYGLPYTQRFESNLGKGNEWLLCCHPWGTFTQICPKARWNPGFDPPIEPIVPDMP